MGKGLECAQKRRTRLGLGGVTWEGAEGSGFVCFGEKEAEGQPHPLCSFLRRGHGEGSADLMGMLLSKQGQGGSGWTLGSVSL